MVLGRSLKKADAINYAIYTVFAICLSINIYFLFVGFSHTLLDRHAFRQTQTAISTYYTIQDGFKLDYETPVLGKPWSIPFEFPFYQWTTASLVLLSGMPLDQAGRFVSILFYYASLGSVFFIIKNITSSARNGLVALSMILTSPLYIFWSRAFMIESMALFFGLSYIAFFLKYVKDSKEKFVVLMVLSGILSGLVKVTTFMVSSIPVLLLLLYKVVKDIRTGNLREFVLRLGSREYVAPALAVLLPYGLASLWVSYADRLKELNPLAAGYITSKALTTWNFGTWDLRFTGGFWERIYFFLITYGIGSSLVFSALLLMLLFNRRYFWPIALSLTAFLAGPLIFSNLYWEHDYYHYANTVFLLIALALSLISLLEKERTAFPALFVLLLSLFFMIRSYVVYYYPLQANNHEVPSEALFMRKMLPVDAVVLMNDHLWSSEIPYYAQRKAIMNTLNYGLRHEALKKAITIAGEENIAAFVSNRKNDEFNDYFDLFPVSVFSNLYVRKHDYERMYRELFHVDIARSSASPYPIKIISYAGDFRLFAHPISFLRVPAQGSEKTFTARFGLMKDALFCTDGAEFVITHVSVTGNKTELLRSYVNPLAVFNDRSIQERTVDVKGLGKGDLLLQTLPGKTSACDLTFWSNIAFDDGVGIEKNDQLIR